uniref:Reverse transcriptase Ty1/copia-type domain-containing protein n=1 Tax=Chenopodium quinoa TaxID=63459 RepID=A0A803MGI4_CHEQI
MTAGLPEAYAGTVDFIQNQEPLPTFESCRSRLKLADRTIKNRLAKESDATSRPTTALLSTTGSSHQTESSASRPSSKNSKHKPRISKNSNNKARNSGGPAHNSEDGQTQQQGIDCDETFSPVVKPATIRTVLSIAISHSWPIHQLDVKNAFLHGYLNETVYMHQPMGFRDKSRPDHVCLLRGSLYGLKQAPRAWQGSDTAYILLYVDDIILTASSDRLRTHIMDRLSSKFAMKDLL